jgi:hypothetical protein
LTTIITPWLSTHVTWSPTCRAAARYHLRDPQAADYLPAFRLDPVAWAREAARLIAEGIARDADDALRNNARHLQLNEADPLAYARCGLTLAFLGRADEAAPHRARLDELVTGAAEQWDQVLAAVHS